MAEANSSEARIRRRDILRYFMVTAGCFVAPAGARLLNAETAPITTKSAYRFPQGVASADPQSDAIVLWTRLEGGDGDEELVVQVSRTPDFAELVSESTVTASPTLDRTVRVLVTDLDADRHYYYRFIAPDGGASRVGRTRTAPAYGEDRPLRIAVFSCQDYELGYFTAYRRLLLDDLNSNDESGIDFAVHLGDFIYETARRPESMTGAGPGDRRTYLRNRDGSLRRCTPLPSGGAPAGRNWVVPTGLDDYRALYKAYLSDPDLQEARARYPFVQTWDDHEFKNDAWQSYFEDEPLADLKVAANQAWFEFIPAALSMGGRDVPNHQAKDFDSVEVMNRPSESFDDNFLSLEANNVAAIESLTIYRSLRWGRTAELFMTDLRSYRGPRGFPQELLTVGNHPYPPAPVDPALIRVLSEGRTAHGGNPPDEIEYLGNRLPNPRKEAPFSSMMGGRQKAWLKDGLARSEAKWKLLGLSVGLMRHGFDSSFRHDGFVNGILWTDGWDGYPAERAELTRFIRQNDIGNVVSLTGDRHIHMAGVVLEDFDREGSSPVIAEFAGGAISAPTRLTIQRRIVSHDEELEALVVFDGERQGYERPVAPSLNAWMLYGAAAARALHDGKTEAEVVELDNPRVNRHMSYADADAHGYYVVRLANDRCDVEFVAVQEPLVLPAEGETAVRRRVKFTLNAWTAGEPPELQLKELVGNRPLGGLRG
jgi:alkaline phosphatase D